MSACLACSGPKASVPEDTASTAPPHEPTNARPQPDPTAEPAQSASSPPTASVPTAPPEPKSPERVAYEAALPVFEKYCASCHTTGRPQATPKALEHFKMDGYPFGGHHDKTIASEIRRAIGAKGRKATMPLGAPGSVKGDELALVLRWADAFDAAHVPAADGHTDHKH